MGQGQLAQDEQMRQSNRRLTVAIPCLNEARFIGRCLASLMNADTAGTQMTVVVCDGMSDDGTREVVHDWAARYQNIRLLDNPHRITPKALNLGLQSVAFDFGMILGAHAEVDKNYIRICLDTLDTDPALGCAGGALTNEYSDAVSRAIGAAMGHPFGVGGARFRTGGQEGYVDTVAFGIYRREVFERVGWFDEELVRNQDDELSFRLLKHGSRIKFLPSAKAIYHVRATFAKLSRQYYQYGYWKVYVNRKHRTVTTIRQLMPVLWVSFVIIGAIGSVFLPMLRYPYVVGLASYLIVSLFAGAWVVRSAGDLPRVVRAFWTLHAAYGLGYWAGIVRFFLIRRTPTEHSKRSTR